ERPEVVLDDAPVHRVVHVVEQVDVGDPDRELVDLGGVLAAARLEISLPAQPVDIGGLAQALEEVVRDARRHLSLAVDVDPERLRFNEAALAFPIYPDPHLAPAVRGARTPAAHPQHVAELDGTNQVDHRPANDPQRVGFLKPHLPQLILADVLDMTGAGVEPESALAVDVGDAERPLPVEDVRMPVGHRHHHFVQAHGFAPIAARPPSLCAHDAKPPCCGANCRRPANVANCTFARRYAGRMAKTFVGSRVRQLRSERGFSQAALAQMLDISPSYLNQIEHDVRPLTVAVLLRITEVFGVDATFFASRDDTRLLAELREVTLDHDLGVEVDQSELADVVNAHPALARALVNLHRRYRLTTTQLAAATEDRFSDGSGSGSITMPHEEVRDYFYERQNYLHELDTAAEE